MYPNFDALFLNKVLPYLENLHFPSPPGSSGGSPLDEGGEMVIATENILWDSANLSQQTVTEHQLRLRREEQEKEKVVAEKEEKEEEGEQANKQMQLVRKKSKTTSCIKLKNGCKTQWYLWHYIVFETNTWTFL